jgi:hypothetical protein
MISIKYKNNSYILADYILENAPIYSKGSRSTRDLVTKKEIKDFIYGRKKEEKWIITKGESPKFDKVFIKKSILDTIPELNNEKANDDKGIEEAPPIINLEDNEKFFNNEGTKLDIETRGERDVKKIYFKVKDVAQGFKIQRLQDNILNKDTSYLINEDYKFFMCKNPKNIGKKTNNKITKELFLTYKGILRALFVSRSGESRKFIDWITNIIYTSQMGTEQQKNKLVSQIKGVSYESIQELFSINARELPCVYLTAFNTVEKLRDVMNIDNKYNNDDIVYKFGLTKSFETRKNGHKSEYKKLEKNIEMKLVYFSYIDPLYITEAEKELKTLLSDYKIIYDNHEELLVIPNNILKFVKTIYENIGTKYSGHTSDFNKKILELNNQINILKNNENIYIRDIESKNIEINNIKILYEKEIAHKNMEINNLKLLHEKDMEILKLQLQNKDLELKIAKSNTI